MWLLLLLAAAAARTAAGADCSVGMGCDLALGSYYISRNQNLSYISSLFGIDDYRTLAPYNTGYSNLDYIEVGSRVNVCFRCRCLALPFAPFSNYLDRRILRKLRQRRGRVPQPHHGKLAAACPQQQRLRCS
jgi:chitin elicitor receptor kinase 1